MIERKLHKVIKNRFFNGKAIVLIGARQVGKTTLLHELTNRTNDVLWLNGDELATRTLLQEVSVEKFRSLIGSKTIIIVDEAQRIENIGLKMKLITDNLPNVQLILTGSSSFELANRVNEPLTGRKWEYTLFPLSFAEMAEHTNAFEEIKHLPLRLVYGYYPDVVTHLGDEKEVLKQITDSYLYKDILEWERVKKSDKLVKLLQSLAFQVGSEVSLNELGQQVDLDKNTVEKYIVLLEQAQVVFRLGSLSRNLRNELKTARKIYFYDNGVRNALINNFNDLALRDDTGALWENFAIAERMKRNAYMNYWCNNYFWRTHQQKEIDYLEECDGQLYAYEFKYNSRKAAKVPGDFASSYPEAQFKEVTPANIDEFLMM